MGYAGATFSIFFSLMGAYQAATKTVEDVEDGMDNFLEYFGDDDGLVLRDILKDTAAADNMNNFLRQYTFDLIVMIFAVFWHVLFLIITGFSMAVVIAYKINELDTAANGGNVDINAGWKLLLFGMFYGTVDYLAGVALEYMQTLIIQMIGYNGKEGPTRSS